MRAPAGLSLALLATTLSIPFAPVTVVRGQEASPDDASAAPLVPGDQYTIRVERRGQEATFNGELVRANPQWIVLRCPAEKREASPSLLDRLPVVGRHFGTTAIGRAEDYLWIPREAATVESREPATQRTPRPSLNGDRPPRQTACRVQLVHAGKIQLRDGGMEEIDDEQLTLSVPKRIKTYAPLPSSPGGFMSIANMTSLVRYESRCDREEIPLDDVLCVRVTRVDPASLERR